MIKNGKYGDWLDQKLLFLLTTLFALRDSEHGQPVLWFLVREASDAQRMCSQVGRTVSEYNAMVDLLARPVARHLPTHSR